MDPVTSMRQPEMEQPEAAVAILHTREREESILLMRRAEREGDSWSGHWSFPGGRRDPQDRDLLDTALRELAEECGIRLAREHVEAALPLKLARRKEPPFIVVAPFVFRVEGQLATVLDPIEAAGAAWVPLRMLLDPTAHTLRPVPGRPRNMLFPAVDVGGTPLWGFTYRLITFWLDQDPKLQAVERAGADAAAAVLDFLRAQGLTLDRCWSDRAAVVRGAIPVDSVLQHFSKWENFLTGVNYLEVHPDRIRIAGLEWEEYWIRVNA